MSDVKCENCYDEPALVQCVQCARKLGEKCNRELHKLAANRMHQRNPLPGVVRRGSIIDSTPPQTPAPPKTPMRPSFSSPLPPVKGGNEICENCDEQTAVIKCNDCDLLLCDDCNRDMHKPAKMASHVRVAINVPATPATPAPLPPTPSPSILQSTPSTAVPSAAVKAEPCEVCDDKDSTLHCDECSMDLCSTCDIELHKPAKNAKHVRKPIGGGPPLPSVPPTPKPMNPTPTPPPATPATPIISAPSVPSVPPTPKTHTPFPTATTPSAAVAATQLCDNCDELTATVYCADCDQYFCDNDNKDMHAPAKMKSHKISPVHSNKPPATPSAPSTTPPIINTPSAVPQQTPLSPPPSQTPIPTSSPVSAKPSTPLPSAPPPSITPPSIVVPSGPSAPPPTSLPLNTPSNNSTSKEGLHVSTERLSTSSINASPSPHGSVEGSLNAVSDIVGEIRSRLEAIEKKQEVIGEKANDAIQEQIASLLIRLDGALGGKFLPRPPDSTKSSNVRSRTGRLKASQSSYDIKRPKSAAVNGRKKQKNRSDADDGIDVVKDYYEERKHRRKADDNEQRRRVSEVIMAWAEGDGKEKEKEKEKEKDSHEKEKEKGKGRPYSRSDRDRQYSYSHDREREKEKDGKYYDRERDRQRNDRERDRDRDRDREREKDREHRHRERDRDRDRDRDDRERRGEREKERDHRYRDRDYDDRYHHRGRHHRESGADETHRRSVRQLSLSIDAPHDYQKARHASDGQINSFAIYPANPASSSNHSNGSDLLSSLLGLTPADLDKELERLERQISAVHRPLDRKNSDAAASPNGEGYLDVNRLLNRYRKEAAAELAATRRRSVLASPKSAEPSPHPVSPLYRTHSDHAITNNPHSSMPTRGRGYYAFSEPTSPMPLTDGYHYSSTMTNLLAPPYPYLPPPPLHPNPPPSQPLPLPQTYRPVRASDASSSESTDEGSDDDRYHQQHHHRHNSSVYSTPPAQINRSSRVNYPPPATVPPNVHYPTSSYPPRLFQSTSPVHYPTPPPAPPTPPAYYPYISSPDNNRTPYYYPPTVSSATPVSLPLHH